MKVKSVAACAAAVLMLSACATITRGTKTAFVVETIPSGASVVLSSGQECDATPCTFPDISREAEFSVTISKPGYRTTTHDVTHQTAGAGSAGMAGNVLVGGIIGAAVDANNGSTQDLVPNPLVVHLEAEAPVAAAAPASMMDDAAEATEETAETMEEAVEDTMEEAAEAVEEATEEAPADL